MGINLRTQAAGIRASCDPRLSSGLEPSTTATTVTLVDDVLHLIDRRLAAPDPEQGGALLRPMNGRGVTHFEWDRSAATSRVSYVPSQDLVEEVAVLEATRDLVLAGIVHSHPNGLNRLSGPDLEVTRHLLQRNRHLGWVLMPIVTQLDDTVTLADHETPLEHGRLSCFLARLDERDVLHLAQPAGLRVIPARSLIQAISSQLGWGDNGWTDVVIDSTALIACSFTPPLTAVTVSVLLSHDFPLAAPLVVIDHGDGMTPVPLATVAGVDHLACIDHLITTLRTLLPHEGPRYRCPGIGLRPQAATRVEPTAAPPPDPAASDRPRLAEECIGPELEVSDRTSESPSGHAEDEPKE